MLLEYEAKNILKDADILIPSGMLVDEKSQPQNFPLVLKSQVPIGGRGKLGGIKIVSNQAEFNKALSSLQSLEIKGFTPSHILAEEVIAIDKELYLSLLIDRSAASTMLVASKSGGVEVEDSFDESFLKLPLSRSVNFDSIGQTVADWYDLPDKAFLISDLIEKLYTCFQKNDATLIEINPLVLTSESKLIAADCKIILDESARFRHPEWNSLAQQPVDSNFVILDENGNVATIANGAGLAMATVDAVHEAGLTAANFLDVGGGANEASVLAAFERITTVKSVKAIVINIFAGITRCDEVAKAIISAQSKIATLPPLFIRLSGTNSDIANKMLDDARIGRAHSLAECIESAKKVVL
jgi:succinyl-CoA synthetase beta subunit